MVLQVQNKFDNMIQLLYPLTPVKNTHPCLNFVF